MLTPVLRTKVIVCPSGYEAGVVKVSALLIVLYPDGNTHKVTVLHSTIALCFSQGTAQYDFSALKHIKPKRHDFSSAKDNHHEPKRDAGN